MRSFCPALDLWSSDGEEILAAACVFKLFTIIIQKERTETEVPLSLVVLLWTHYSPRLILCPLFYFSRLTWPTRLLLQDQAVSPTALSTAETLIFFHWCVARKQKSTKICKNK